MSKTLLQRVELMTSAPVTPTHRIAASILRACASDKHPVTKWQTVARLLTQADKIGLSQEKLVAAIEALLAVQLANVSMEALCVTGGTEDAGKAQAEGPGVSD